MGHSTVASSSLSRTHPAHRRTAGSKEDKPHRADTPPKDTLPEDGTTWVFSDPGEDTPEKSWHGHLRRIRMTQMMKGIPWATVMRTKKTKDGCQRYTGCWFNRADTMSEQNKKTAFWLENGQMRERRKILILTFCILSLKGPSRIRWIVELRRRIQASVRNTKISNPYCLVQDVRRNLG